MAPPPPLMMAAASGWMAPRGSQRLLLGCPAALQSSARALSSSTGGSGGGVFKEFVNKVKDEVDKDPSLKESVESIRTKTAGLNEKVKAYQEGAKSQSAGAAEKLSAQQQHLKEQAAKLSGTVGAQASEAAKQLKQALGSGFLGNMKGFAASKEEQQKTQQTQDAAASGQQDGEGSSGEEKAKGAASGGSGRRKWLDSIAREVREVFSPPEEVPSATFRPAVAAPPPETDSGPSELVEVKREESAWEKRFGTLKEQVGKTPLFQQLYSQVEKVKESPAGKKVSEQATKVRARVSNMKEDLHEKWETSDSAVVHGIQNMQDSMFAETERAASMRVIRERDQGFDMVRFLLGVRADIPTVLKAYLTGDAATLGKHCSKEMVERLTGQYKFMTAEGQVIDSTILDTGEIELVDVKVLEGNPLVVVRFSVQQINCARDKFGNVTEGAPDDVQRVYYLWALQQEESGIVDEAGKYWPPRWQLREMLVQGMHNLI